MVQYLYAAYSVQVIEGQPNTEESRNIQALILQIALEEMGHLKTVQNLLHLLGRPFNFEREHSRFQSEICPFRFKLEPLTLDSLAKYVVAESPVALPADFPPEDRAVYEEIKVRARRSNDGEIVNHIGPLFARLAGLFRDNTSGIRDDDFPTDTASRQGKVEDWWFERKNENSGEELIVGTFTVDLGSLRRAATRAVEDISQHGKGFDLPPAGRGQPESHFKRFFDIYKRADELLRSGTQLTWRENRMEPS